MTDQELMEWAVSLTEREAEAWLDRLQAQFAEWRRCIDRGETVRLERGRVVKLPDGELGFEYDQ